MKRIVGIFIATVMVFGVFAELPRGDSTGYDDFMFKTSDIIIFSSSFSTVDPPAAGSVAISNREQLDTVRNNLRGVFHLTNNIDLCAGDCIDPDNSGICFCENNWLPIGDNSNRFRGTFDGQGFEIENLKIQNNFRYNGLFGYTESATIRNVGLATSTSISVHRTGTNDIFVGGISGFNRRSYIGNSYNKGIISAISPGTVYIGGIAGNNSGSIINSCYNMGDISVPLSRTVYAGGIAGTNNRPGIISNCYNMGNLSFVSTGASSNRTVYAGGICGENRGGISNCYNTSNTIVVSGISNTMRAHLGGLVGRTFGSDGNLRNSFWNIDSPNHQIVNGAEIIKRGVGTGTDSSSWLTTSQMRNPGSFPRWNFVHVWNNDPAINDGYPFLRLLGYLSGINYDINEIIVPGTVDGFSINLTRETITVPSSYTVQAFSTDGGRRWRAIRPDTLSDARFPRLLNRNLDLRLSDKAIDSTLRPRRPAADANIVEFNSIRGRPKPPRLRVNLLIGRSRGDWLLAEDRKTAHSASVRKDDIEVAVADVNNRNRIPDRNGFGVFFPGPINGIPIPRERTSFLFRFAPAIIASDEPLESPDSPASPSSFQFADIDETEVLAYSDGTLTEEPEAEIDTSTYIAASRTRRVMIRPPR
jgi:hypothetical protein